MNEDQLKIKSKIIEVTEMGLTDKSNLHSYDDIYPFLFDKYINKKKLNIFELGTGFGGGLLILSELFPNSDIYALDHNYTGPYCLKPDTLPNDRKEHQVINLDNRNIKFLDPMDQSNPDILNQLPSSIDIIIDDASHDYSKSMESFNLLLPNLKKGGIYIIEDVYPQFYSLYENDGRFKIFNNINVKNRTDDVIAVFYN